MPFSSAHPLEKILVDCKVCTEFEARKYVRRLRQDGYDSIWALKSVSSMEGLHSVGIEKKLHRIMLWRVLQEPGAIPDPNLPVSSTGCYEAVPCLTYLSLLLYIVDLRVFKAYA